MRSPLGTIAGSNTGAEGWMRHASAAGFTFKAAPGRPARSGALPAAPRGAKLPPPHCVPLPDLREREAQMERTGRSAREHLAAACAHSRSPL